MIPRRLRAWFKLQTQRLTGHWGLIARVLFCLAVGLVMLFSSLQGNYDTRFALRGPQTRTNDIVIINLSREAVPWIESLADQNSKNTIWSLKEIVETSDSFYWHPDIWERALSKVAQAKPKSIVVTLFFGDETVRGTMTTEQQLFFRRIPVFWTAKTDSYGHAITPGLASANGHNVGTMDLRTDPDGKLRHFLSQSLSMPHLAVRLANHYLGIPGGFSNDSHMGQPINFQGNQEAFKSFSFTDLIHGRIKPSIMDGKIVIFTLKDISAHDYQTPMGLMSDGAVLANLVHNFIHNQWIVEIPTWVSILYLVLVLGISLWIILQFPQLVAFVFLTFLSAAILTLSATCFDLLALWVPVAAPLATILAAYMVITSYRLSESEKFSWEAERELHYLGEVESLKNNFLSLISHDLKNPLAKIQGITDRLLNVKDEVINNELKEDLGNIKETSEELRQYITSILQLTRVEARNIKLTKEVSDINSVIMGAVERLEPLAFQKQIKIESHLEPIFSMEFDTTLITEVLINLIENAIKYSDNNSKIKITSSEVGETVRVEVADNGGGIPEAEISKVFDKFYRGMGDKTLKVTGTGLGLYLVKYFIELHGGKVFINSQMGMGTTVGFALPLDEPEENYAEFTRSHR